MFLILTFFVISILTRSRRKFLAYHDVGCSNPPSEVRMYPKVENECLRINKDGVSVGRDVKYECDMVNKRIVTRYWIATPATQTECSDLQTKPMNPILNDTMDDCVNLLYYDYSCEDDFTPVYDAWRSVTWFLVMLEYSDPLCESYPVKEYAQVFPVNKCFAVYGKYYLIEGQGSSFLAKNYSDNRCENFGGWIRSISYNTVLGGGCRNIGGGLFGSGNTRFGVINGQKICYKSKNEDEKFFTGLEYCGFMGGSGVPGDGNDIQAEPYKFQVGFVFLFLLAADLIFVVSIMLCCCFCILVSCFGFTVRAKPNQGMGLGKIGKKRKEVRYSKFTDEEDDDHGFSSHYRDAEERVEREMMGDGQELGGGHNLTPSYPSQKVPQSDPKNINWTTGVPTIGADGSINQGEEDLSGDIVTSSDGEFLDEGGESIDVDFGSDDLAPSPRSPQIEDFQSPPSVPVVDYIDDEFEPQEPKLSQSVQQETDFGEDTDDTDLRTPKPNRILNIFLGIINIFLDCIDKFRKRNGLVSLLASSCLCLPCCLYFFNSFVIMFLLSMAIISFVYNWTF